MTANRILTKDELNYITRKLKNTKKQVFWILILVVVIVGTTAVGVYVFEDANDIVINIAFGLLILLIGFLHWIFKGYKNHQIDPTVFRNRGFYKRIYEQHGKHGAYYDTINGINVKLPWHWRNYLKNYKGEITYEYIVRDGAVAINERSNYFIVAVNDKLSLDYELQNGLQQTKRVSIIEIVSLALLLPVILISSIDRHFENALKIDEVFKTPVDDSVVLNNPEELTTLSSSNYIKIKKAWVYQYNKNSFGNKNYIISETERNRIYNHPSSDFNYRFFIPTKHIKKPDLETLKRQLKNNPISKIDSLFKKIDSSIFNNAAEKAYNYQVQEYESKLKRSKKTEDILEQLQPKTFISIIYEDVFNAPKERLYSIRESLEEPYTIEGFYMANEKRLISFKQQEAYKKDIRDAFILMSICTLVTIVALIGVFKIIVNSRLKLRLVKEQLNTNNFKRLT